MQNKTRTHPRQGKACLSNLKDLTQGRGGRFRGGQDSMCRCPGAPSSLRTSMMVPSHLRIPPLSLCLSLRRHSTSRAGAVEVSEAKSCHSTHTPSTHMSLQESCKKPKICNYVFRTPPPRPGGGRAGRERGGGRGPRSRLK